MKNNGYQKSSVKKAEIAPYIMDNEEKVVKI